MYTLIAALALASSCSGLITGGPGCCKNVTVDPNFSLAAMSSVHGGAWPYAQIVRTKNTDKFQSIFQIVVPYGNNEYKRFIFYRDSDGLLGVLRQTTEPECTSGEPMNTLVDSVLYKTSVLYFSPTCMVVYICNEDAKDNGFDYWYALTNGDTAFEQEETVQKIRKEFGLRGEPKTFDLSCM